MSAHPFPFPFEHSRLRLREVPDPRRGPGGHQHPSQQPDAAGEPLSPPSFRLASPAPPRLAHCQALAQRGQSIAARVFELIRKDFPGRRTEPLRDTFTCQIASPYLLPPRVTLAFCPNGLTLLSCLPHPSALSVISYLFSHLPYPPPHWLGIRTLARRPHMPSAHGQVN